MRRRWWASPAVWTAEPATSSGRSAPHHTTLPPSYHDAAPPTPHHDHTQLLLQSCRHANPPHWQHNTTLTFSPQGQCMPTSPAIENVCVPNLVLIAQAFFFHSTDTQSQIPIITVTTYHSNERTCIVYYHHTNNGMTHSCQSVSVR